ncbi:glycerol-3-phosphate 1-O-acyltransferase PlsY [Salinisphaera sp. USBA-960]|uniref:glycerol-3-phosphate 1-O-acyltransferase PlsY n=1 Tax=Salinisphaera orenii TaxID=856731 RepID=UPI000DBE824C|nr:glycerol-3-phosphate 1-O-acyltransferase PlsY [Salifodinibacter halophilus]NNC27249.1 glycerol-3-phosphate 1-O-acyltransferase PlsY [Salifodinibacter halophilus]
MAITQYVIVAVLAYLIGSLSGSLIIGPILGRDDPRNGGSHNAGATNALRTGGALYGALVLAFDGLKGVVAVIALPLLVAVGPPAGMIAGAAAVIGHLYPVFFGFRGGKGFATVLGALIAGLPLTLVVVAVVFAATLVTSGYVGLATVLSMWGVMVFCAAAPFYGLAAKLFTLAMSLVITYTHRGNIQRTWQGTEHRFDKAMWRPSR